jgi:hypothetical protein
MPVNRVWKYCYRVTLPGFANKGPSLHECHETRPIIWRHVSCLGLSNCPDDALCQLMPGVRGELHVTGYQTLQGYPSPGSTLPPKPMIPRQMPDGNVQSSIAHGRVA